jgi:hypothetical protein
MYTLLISIIVLSGSFLNIFVHLNVTFCFNNLQTCLLIVSEQYINELANGSAETSQ